MQLTWGDVLKKNPRILEILNIYFNAMAERNAGKASTHFHERAEDLGTIVLTNKTHQKTRFVRALLRGLTAALRNLPTLVAVIAEECENAANEHDNTSVKKLTAIWKKLEDGKNLVFTIGMAQLLEMYSEVSLEAQQSFHFPIQVWNKILQAKENLGKLADKWEWSNNTLKLAGIGTPQLIIDRLVETGIYVPFVPPGSVRRHKQMIKDFDELLAEQNTNNEKDLFDEENQIVLELAGSVNITGVTNEMIKSVETKLQEIAVALKTAWDKRQVESGLQRVLLKAFGTIYTCNDQDETEFMPQMIDHLNQVIQHLPPRQAETISAHDCLNGYIEWNKFWKSSASENPLSTIHVVYENWVKQCKGDHADFCHLFEMCMIRIMSEAMAETIGSMMSAHCGKGRYLNPHYFSMELVLRFNLGPLHLLEGLVKEILESQQKQYQRKDKLNRFSTSNINLSAAAYTYRRNAETFSRFPVQFWSDWKA